MMTALPKKPAVGGMPTSDSRNRVIVMPSSGARRPSPAKVAIWLVTPGRRWSAATHAKAPRFMNAYATA